MNFKDLYYYNGNRLPFAAAQIGQAFRNEVVELSESPKYFFCKIDCQTFLSYSQSNNLQYYFFN